MKNRWLKYVVVALVAIALCSVPISSAYADVGNQNDYDSDGGGDWSSDYSSSDDSSYRDSSSSSSSSGSSNGSLVEEVVSLIVAGVVVIAMMIYVPRRESAQSKASPSKERQAAIDIFKQARDNEIIVVRQVKAHDQYFSEQAFEGWAKEVFMTLNEAWSARDYERLRPLENSALYNEHSKQIKKYLSDRQINKIERLGIGEAYLTEFNVEANFEYLTILLKAQMIDYIISEDTGEIVAGNKDTVTRMAYYLTFERTAGARSKTDLSNTITTDCPSCGAPMQIAAGGRCEYCRSILKSNEHGWVLSDYRGTRLKR